MAVIRLGEGLLEPNRARRQQTECGRDSDNDDPWGYCAKSPPEEVLDSEMNLHDQVSRTRDR